LQAKLRAENFLQAFLTKGKALASREAVLGHFRLILSGSQNSQIPLDRDMIAAVKLNI
jgi:hypothetical protein